VRIIISIREQRWKSFELTYGHLPIWLQVALFPWTVPARWLFYFPVLTPALSLSGAAFLAYLKLNYLHEQVTWPQVGLMGIAPLLAPAVILYVAIPIAMVVTLLFASPIYAFLILERWWNGKPLPPFSLDPPEKRAR
jgi:hypothetical protein